MCGLYAGGSDLATDDGDGVALEADLTGHVLNTDAEGTEQGKPGRGVCLGAQQGQYIVRQGRAQQEKTTHVLKVVAALDVPGVASTTGGRKEWEGDERNNGSDASDHGGFGRWR